MKPILKLADRLAELTVALSYTAPGYRLRTRLWDPGALDVGMEGRVCLVTGANSGIGRATVEGLAGLGATVILVCRNEGRGLDARDSVRRETGNDSVRLEVADVSTMSAVRDLAARVKDRYDRLDVLVNNAGVMLPERRLSEEGIEMTFATNVLGGFLLTHELLPLLKRSAPSRIVHVTSGGMYAQKLDADDLQFEGKPYSGVTAYARTKRAQVILSERWAQRLESSRVVSNCMHPGWAATPGVATSLPRFNRVFGRILRSSAQGADTIIWLAASSEASGQTGKLFFDRRPRRTHVLPGTRSPERDRLHLWNTCARLTGIQPPDPEDR